MKGFALQKTRDRRVLGAGMLAFGVGVVMIAYIVICARTGSSWPWLEVVHEDGERTLLGSLFYFEHAMRELPLDVLLALAIGGSALAILPAGDRASARLGRRRVGGLALVAAFVIATILVGTAWHGGVSAVLDNLLQYHTRPGAPLEWGAHWRYHLLSRLALLMLAIGMAGFLQLLIGVEGRAIARTGPTLVASSLLAFLALTIFFAASPRSLLAPVRDAVYIGHQAREIFTHVLVTLPAAWGLCLLLSRPAEHADAAERSAPRGWTLLAMSIGIAGALLGASVCLASLLLDAASHGQTADIAMLLCPHFFEHGATYLVVPVVAALVYEVGVGRTR